MWAGVAGCVSGRVAGAVAGPRYGGVLDVGDVSLRRAQEAGHEVGHCECVSRSSRKGEIQN